MNVQMSVIKGAMIRLAEGQACGSIEALGIQPEDLHLLCGDIPWKGVERTLVTRTLDSLMFGTMDLLALPRFKVPVEYVAAAITMFVKPTNLMVACQWMECGNPTASDLAGPNTSSNVEPCMAITLFALVQMMANDAVVASCRTQFEKRTNLYLVEATQGGSKNAKR